MPEPDPTSNGGDPLRAATRFDESAAERALAQLHPSDKHRAYTLALARHQIRLESGAADVDWVRLDELTSTLALLDAHEWLTAYDRAGLAAHPAPGDRVRLTYRDGSGCEGTWERTPDGDALRRDDGTLHTHVHGQVHRDVVRRAGEAGAR